MEEKRKRLKRRIERHSIIIKALTEKMKRMQRELAAAEADSSSTQCSEEEGEIKEIARAPAENARSIYGMAMEISDDSSEYGASDKDLNSYESLCRACKALARGNLPKERGEELGSFIRSNIQSVLKSFFDNINADGIATQKAVMHAVSPNVERNVKCVILHDIILYAKDLSRLVILAEALFPEGMRDLPGEVGRALKNIMSIQIHEDSIEYDLQGAVSAMKEDLGLDPAKISLPGEVARIINEFKRAEIFYGPKIPHDVFDAATAIRLYCSCLDWDWTYNFLVRETLHGGIKDEGLPFLVYVLGILYIDGRRFMDIHKSLDLILQTLDRVAGVGHGESIVDTAYSLDAQLASILVVRQFRPGVGIRWYKQRLEERMQEGNGEQQRKIEDTWKMHVY